MKNQPPSLTRRQCRDIEDFLRLFTDVETGLKHRLGLQTTDRTGIGVLIERYAEINPLWSESANQLRVLSEIRNLLTHQRSHDHGYPVAIAPRSLLAIRQVVADLQDPEPVSVWYRKEVMTVSPDNNLATVLALAFERGFSQFPVTHEGRFSGLITENEIVRWLGRRTQSSTQVDLSAVSVRNVIKEKDPFFKGIPIFCFAKLDTPVKEVMSRFSTQRALEVVLLTPSGHKDTPLEGIVTQWDAARHPLQRLGPTAAKSQPSRGA